MTRLSKMNPVQLLVHILCMFGLGVIWLSTAGIVIMNPKVAYGVAWETKMFILYSINDGHPRIGYPQGELVYGELFTFWGIISRYWWLSLAPTLSFIYFLITRKK